ncbi:hypothetical protein Q8F57_027605 [Paraburkholderia terrae]|uniref:hypothetical protein n=1 Tax=Paraburkholderia terrae TaxID=311230 RepID=UPI00296AF6A8|nr:hypothetical protein [Paraburkholderia terrae]MDW3661268.1 hypothetical protein [Paraburkholderia terrae]
MNAPSLFQPVHPITALALVAGAMALSGCMLDPPGPSPIYSRLPADQSGIAATAQPLTPEERARYDAIDKQVMAEQNQAMAADAAAQAYSRYAAPPVSVYGSYYSGGWGHGWGTGIGYGYAPGWGW